MLKIIISTDNAAFEDETEILRILANVRPAPGSEGRIRDINGNTVGHWEWCVDIAALAD